MNKDNQALLLFPFFSIMASSLIMAFGIRWMFMTFIFGIIINGVLTFIIVAKFKINASPFMKGKLLSLLVYAILNIFAWISIFHNQADEFVIFLIPVISLFTETYYALTKGKNWKEIVALCMTNLNITYLAFVTDFVHGWSTNAPWF